MQTPTTFQILAWVVSACFLLGTSFAFSKITYRRFFAGGKNSGQFIIEGMSMGLVAAIMFGVGLVGGLTPSEGAPSLTAWVVFAIVPLGLTLLSFFVTKDWVLRVFLMVETGGIVALTTKLLRLFHVF